MIKFMWSMFRKIVEEAICLYVIKSHIRRSYCIMEVSGGAEVAKRKISEADLADDASEVKKVKADVGDLNKQHIVDNNADVNSTAVKRARKPKKSVVLLCYQGKNYFGMQRNHGVSTVEDALLKALLKADIILPDECECPKLMKFQRAARTDKGVSAVRQVVSMKVPLDYISDSFPARVNLHLPPEIRVLGIKRVTQAFDAKIACDARTYAYMLPTFALSSDSDVAEEYRISESRIQEVNQFLKSFVGTHNFYNFTSGRLPTDNSCKRYIISCECGEPFMKEGLEFVIFKVKGQSFMLHQIRKMVGLTIAVARKLVAAEEILEKVWKADRIDVPIAPGLGLMLEEVHYDWYNKKFGGDGMHERLDWNYCQDAINAFREKEIYNNIAVTEKTEKSMLQWLLTLSLHTFDVRDLQTEAEEKDKPDNADANSE